MAELNTSGSSSRKGRTLLPKVDLTAMVDLAFLLITFFMLTTSLTKPNAMSVAMPVNAPGPVEISEDRSITICVGAMQTYWYKGQIAAPIAQGLISNRDLRSFLMKHKKEVWRATQKGLFVLVKPSNNSKYENLVNTLDELTITEINQYAICELDGNEKELLSSKGLQFNCICNF